MEPVAPLKAVVLGTALWLCLCKYDDRSCVNNFGVILDCLYSHVSVPLPFVPKKSEAPVYEQETPFINLNVVSLLLLAARILGNKDKRTETCKSINNQKDTSPYKHIPIQIALEYGCIHLCLTSFFQKTFFFLHSMCAIHIYICTYIHI